MSATEERPPATGLFVFRARRIERLARALAARLAPAPNRDPFTPVRLAVGSRGMARWLRQELAGRLGVTANLSFRFPAQAIEELIAAAEGEPESRGACWSPDALTWAVLEVLPGLLGRPELGPLRRYLAREFGGADPAVDRRTWALAREIADTLDRYAHFRRDWLAAWSRGVMPDELQAQPDAAWQACLYRALAAHLGQPSFADRLARLLAGPEATPGSSHDLFVFGVSSLPPAFVEALARHALRARVELYLLCPSNLFWGDLRRGYRELRRSLLGHDREGSARLLAEQLERQNPLLTSLGRASRDFQVVLEELAPGYQEPRDDLFAEEEPRDLLGWLQADIQELRDLRDLPPRPLPPGDDSLRVHACHGPTRQVEALREALLHLLADHPDLEPRDVVVMTPDVELFAPLATAIFARAADGSPAIPLAVDDRSASSLSPFAEALCRVLALGEARVTASAVMDLLALPPVRRRFSLSVDDLAVTRALIRESGVRWGLDAADQERAGQPATALNTWRFGLARLALGAVMPDEGELVQGLLPCAEVEGPRLEVFGRLAEAVSRLAICLESLRAPRRLASWAEDLAAALDALTAAEEGDAWLREEVLAVLAQLTHEQRDADCARPLELPVVRRLLEQRTGRPAGWAPPLANAVTLCALQPMRSVPHRVVCLLGLDDGVFPRTPAGHSFDLTRAHGRLGDREPRDEDRHLLLEALLSAREHLLLFYTGHDVHTGQALPPAVPLGELMEVIAASFRAPAGDVRSIVLVQHPLQPFDPRLFQATGGRPPRSFEPGLRAAATRLRGARAEAPVFFPPGLVLPEEPREVLGLDELAAFLAHPVRALLRGRLGLRLEQDDEALDDREPMELDPLTRWQLEDEMLSLALDGLREEEILPRVQGRARARGVLPLGGAGETEVAAAWAQIGELLAVSREERAAPRAPVELRLPPLAPGQPALHALVPGVGPAGDLVRLTASDLAGGGTRLLLRTWLELLALEVHALRPGRVAHVLGRRGERVSLRAPADARGVLAALVALHGRGMCRPLRLPPRTAAAFAQALAGQPGPWEHAPADVLSRAAARARPIWSGRPGTAGEAEDGYLRLAFGPRPPFAAEGAAQGLHPEFLSQCWTLWGALDAARVRPAGEERG